MPPSVRPAKLTFSPPPPPRRRPSRLCHGRAAFAVQVLSLPVEQVAVAGLQQLQEDGAGIRHGRGYHAARAERLHGDERL